MANKRLDRKMLGRSLKDALAEEIRRLKLAPGTPILSSRRLAEKYEVSLITANNAINALVQEGVLYREPGSGTYVAGSGAGGADAINVGISFDPDSADGMREASVSIGMYYRAAVERLTSRKCGITYLSFQDFHDPILLKGLDGVIVSHGFLDAETLPILKGFAGQVVAIQHEYVSEVPFHQVIPDLRTGFAEAARHLYDRGHRELYMASTPSAHSKNRVDLFIAAAKEAGFDPDKIEIVKEQMQIGDLGRAAGQRVGKRILAERKCRGIYSTSDFISFGIIDEMRSAGLKPGVDMDLASFDDLESDGLTPFGKPMLSSLYNPRKEISTCAADFLYSAIQNKEQFPHIIRIPAKFIVRESTSGVLMQGK